MAPEQLALFLKEGSGRVDERCDVYSLGVVLFELLTGRLPFEPVNATTETEYNRERLGMQRAFSASVSWAKWNLPPVVERVLRRCLDPDSEKRYGDAGELARALAHAFEILAIGSKLPAGGRLTRWSERRPIAMLIALMLLPQFAGSVVNIAYNSVQIRLNPAQQAAFGNVVLGFNLIVYPIAIFVVVRLMMPLVRAWRQLPGSGAMTGQQIDAIRMRALSLGSWVVLVALAGWLPGGLIFPLLIDLSAGSVPWQVYAHFLVSFALSGLIAVVYSHFGIQFVMLRIFYAQLGNADTFDRSTAHAELARAGRWLTPFQYFAGVVPLAGAVLLLAFGDMDLSFRLLVAGLIVVGMLGAFIAMTVAGRLNRLIIQLAGGRGE
jgi:hypothetical protein